MLQWQKELRGRHKCEVNAGDQQKDCDHHHHHHHHHPRSQSYVLGMFIEERMAISTRYWVQNMLF
jgi:hypothetical protein